MVFDCAYCGDDVFHHLSDLDRDMKLTIELELEATFYQDNNDNVRMEALRFPGSTQNIMPFLSPVELIRAQKELECAYEQSIIDKAAEIAEKRDMAGDFKREQFRDDMLSRHAKQAHNAIFGSKA